MRDTSRSFSLATAFAFLSWNSASAILLCSSALFSPARLSSSSFAIFSFITLILCSFSRRLLTSCINPLIFSLCAGRNKLQPCLIQQPLLSHPQTWRG